MRIAYVYESVGRPESSESAPEAPDSPRRIELANSVVEDLLAEFERLEQYEKKYGPSMEDESGDRRALEVLRSFWQMFEAWVQEAEPVYERARQIPSARQHIPKLEQLAGKLVFAKMRLITTPEAELESARRFRRGEGIRTTVEELRNELRRRRRA